jgi:hypothetical protein
MFMAKPNKALYVLIIAQKEYPIIEIVNTTVCEKYLRKITKVTRENAREGKNQR